MAPLLATMASPNLRNTLTHEPRAIDRSKFTASFDLIGLVLGEVAAAGLGEAGGESKWRRANFLGLFGVSSDSSSESDFS